MKILTTAIISVLFSASIWAGNGSGQTGPNVECELKNGSVKYIPILVCKAEGGKVI